MKSQNKKQNKSAGRPPTYEEVFIEGGSFLKELLLFLNEGKKVMASSMAGKTKIQIGMFILVKMKGYVHKSGADGSTRKLKAFNRVKFVPTKQFKEIIKNI